MRKSEKRTKMEQEFVTLYRLNWGNTIGLETSRVTGMSDRELEMSLDSQRKFPGKFRGP
jgi:hypothetical protein